MTVHAVPEADDKSELYLSTMALANKSSNRTLISVCTLFPCRKIVAVDQWEDRLTLSVD